MARVEGFEPAQSGQEPVDSSENPVPVGVWGDSSTGVGVFGTNGAISSSADNIPIDGPAGVVGHSVENPGVNGESLHGLGMLGRSRTGTGVLGVTFGAPPDATGVYGSSTTGGNGVVGFVGDGTGVVGSSVRGTGVRGFSGAADGVLGETIARGSAGVRGRSDTGVGVAGSSTSQTGVAGHSDAGIGVAGDSRGGFFSAGVVGASSNGFISAGLFGTSDAPLGIGVYGRGGPNGFAGFLDGRVEVIGPLVKSGGGFKIDHPLDTAQKSLSHSFVESPERKNVYDGVTTLDQNGECCVELPEWFEALNCDFRYQLTSIGGPAPNLHVAQEISNNRFNIAGGKSGMKVSWQVTGIRKDAWAQANPLLVEEEKPENERGRYRHPELYNQPPENNIFWKGNAELMRQLEEQRPAAEPPSLDRDRLEQEWRRVEGMIQRRR
jgi:hypothetical protein